MKARDFTTKRVRSMVESNNFVEMNPYLPRGEENRNDFVKDKDALLFACKVFRELADELNLDQNSSDLRNELDQFITQLNNSRNIDQSKLINIFKDFLNQINTKTDIKPDDEHYLKEIMNWYKLLPAIMSIQDPAENRRIIYQNFKNDLKPMLGVLKAHLDTNAVDYEKPNAEASSTARHTLSINTLQIKEFDKDIKHENEKIASLNEVIKKVEDQLIVQNKKIAKQENSTFKKPAMLKFFKIERDNFQREIMNYKTQKSIADKSLAYAEKGKKSCEERIEQANAEIKRLTQPMESNPKGRSRSGGTVVSGQRERSGYKVAKESVRNRSDATTIDDSAINEPPTPKTPRP